MSRQHELQRAVRAIAAQLPIEVVADLLECDVFPKELLPDIATRELVSGSEDPLLIQLAGLTSAEAADKAREIFLRYAAGVGKLELTEVLTSFAKSVARAILDDKIEPYSGASAIWAAKEALRVETHDLDGFVYSASELEDRPSEKTVFDDAIRKVARGLLISISQ